MPTTHDKRLLPGQKSLVLYAASPSDAAAKAAREYGVFREQLVLVRRFDGAGTNQTAPKRFRIVYWAEHEGALGTHG